MIGTVRAKNVAPAKLSVLQLSPGRWALSPLSTCPLVEVECSEGSTVVTFGQVIELPTPGRIRNASRHLGDLVFVCVPEGASAPAPPRAIALPATFALSAGGGEYVTREIDVRYARRVILAIADLTSGGTIEWTRTHRVYDRGTGFDTGTPANQAGLKESFISLFVHREIPCGMGSGQFFDTAAVNPSMLQSVHPHALLDTVQVEAPVVDLAARGFEIAGPPAQLQQAMFVLEY